MFGRGPLGFGTLGGGGRCLCGKRTLCLSYFWLLPDIPDWIERMRSLGPYLR